MIRSRQCGMALACATLVFLACAAFLAKKPRLLDDVAFSRAVFDRQGALLRLTIAPDQKYRLFTPLHDIAPALREATLLHEDRHFYAHPGVNPLAVFRAFLQTYLAGGRKLGASTITMQLARLKYGLYTRNFTGKLMQMAQALRFEWHYSKDEILEAYLNLAPYGYNIEGAGAAGAIYFHAAPRDLTLPQALTLAAIPQSPTRRRPEAANATKPALIAARNQLFGEWLSEHSEAAAQKPFFALPMPTYGIADIPFEAPHLTNKLLAQYPDSPVITATIDLEVQKLLETILAGYVRDRRETGIENGAALLVDTRSMQAVASIGSADFRNRAIKGQIDATRVGRSPGSALKPFIYALAFDQGLIHPYSVLGDAPASFGSYTPDNFDHDFRGPITVRDALRLSRNIPAIKLAARLRHPDLYDFYAKAGVSKLKAKQDYGLSLVLGTAPVTMRALAGLYAALANDGNQRPIMFQTTINEPQDLKRLLSPEASFMTLDILSATPRPFHSENETGIYWKTGTSNGYHDAWSAGVFGHYVLIVWVGNMDGRNSPALTGIRAAAPLFFAMADAVKAMKPQRDLIAVKADKLHLRRVDVCASTGDLTLEDCPAVARSWFIPGVSPIKGPNVFRRILVDLATGKRACAFISGRTVYKTYEVWPSDLQQVMRQAGLNLDAMPPPDQNCAVREQGGGGKPVIISPQSGMVYHANLQSGGEEGVTFDAVADGATEYLYWFVDNKYFGKARPGESLQWNPKPGLHNVSVVDNAGRADSSQMQVLAAP
ncbi:MAG: penicillin-binding protein 1C [Alphaproteobacteria bacterium]